MLLEGAARFDQPGLDVVLAGGPSFIDVKQSIVIDVKYTEEFPDDTATFTGVDSKRASGTANPIVTVAAATTVVRRPMGRLPPRQLHECSHY